MRKHLVTFLTPLLKLGFEIIRPRLFPLSRDRLKVLCEDMQGHIATSLEAAVEMNRGNDGFHCICKQRIFFPSLRLVLTTTEPEMISEFQPASDAGQRRFAD